MSDALHGEGVVIGIDPGIARTGYGVLRRSEPYPIPLAFGCIETSSNHHPGRRLLEIYEEVSLLVGEFSPECLVLEQLFFTRNVTSAMSVSEARGVLLLAAEQRRIPVVEYTPNQVKLAVTGSGRADKHQVQEMMRRLLRLQKLPQPDDAADGLAIALCHINNTMR